MKFPTTLVISKATLCLRGLAQSFAILLIGIISVLLIVFYLTLTESPYAIRILSPYLFAILSIVCLANHIVCAKAAANAVIDCYSRAPVDKPTLLAAMQVNFGLKYVLVQTRTGVNSTGSKPNYYSLNKRTANFAYKPIYTSLMSIEKELETIMSGRASE